MEYIKYGFIPSPSNNQFPLCLICGKSFSNEAMKPSRLIEHLYKMHSNKKDCDISYFTNLQENFKNHPRLESMFTDASQQNTNGLLASYKISLLIAKTGKPHTIAEELILPAISEVISTVLHKSPINVIKSIPLSNDTVQRRIDEMADNTANSLYNILRNTEFSLQIDESTLPDNKSLLL